jgi:hypothetical protein
MEIIMKKLTFTIASLGLAGGLAMTAQAQETEPYDPNRDVVTESDRDRHSSMGERQQDTPVESEYDRNPTEQSSTQHSPTDTDPAVTPPAVTQPTETQAGQSSQQMGHAGSDLSGLTAEELEGKKVLTLTGEEVGEIEEVGRSATQQARVATVDVGGFLGIGEKTIAIPLSELEPSVSGEDEAVRTSMTRTSIEALPEFDEADFTAEDE